MSMSKGFDSVNPDIEFSRSRRTGRRIPRPDSRRSRQTVAPGRDLDWVPERERPWQRPGERRGGGVPVGAETKGIRSAITGSKAGVLRQSKHSPASA